MKNSQHKSLGYLKKLQTLIRQHRILNEAKEQ